MSHCNFTPTIIIPYMYISINTTNVDKLFKKYPTSTSVIINSRRGTHFLCNVQLSTFKLLKLESATLGRI